MNRISKGIYPTMITPFTDDGKIDYNAVEELLEWYIKEGVDGVFAVCQSSEMFWLEDDEKLKLLKFIVDRAGGRISVVSSGHTDSDIRHTTEYMKKCYETGTEALVLISCLLAGGDADEYEFKKNTEYVMSELPNAQLGMYECPYPYKYVLPDSLVSWLADTERFGFIKDTCCDINTIKRRIDIINGTPTMLFNANTATLLQSLRCGCDGYSGIMANFHPSLYKWLYENRNDSRADEIGHILTASALIENVSYPMCAKHYLKRHINIGCKCRKPGQELSSANLMDIASAAYIADVIAERIISK